ncbi:MAG: glucosaminidase domain-containing protein [Filifactor alocis]|nr:glucosaminidase domain-containing protein [Filifactor alocis]
MKRALGVFLLVCFLMTGSVSYAEKGSSFVTSNGAEVDLFSREFKDDDDKIKESYVVIDGQGSEIEDNASLFDLKEVSKEPVKLISPFVMGGQWNDGRFLISTDILIKKSEVSSETLERFLRGTNLAGLGKAFKKAEQDHGVNALFLMGLAIHESNAGTSRIAVTKNNLFGFRAYDSSPFESAKAFVTREEGIDTVARYLSKNYLTPGGRYFRGYSIEAVNVHYATDPNWAKGIKIRISNFLKK